MTGSPGGSRTITTVLQMLINTIDFGMNVAEATNAALSSSCPPDELRVERGLARYPEITQESLKTSC